MARVTKAMLEEENARLRNSVGWYGDEVRRLKGTIETLESCGDGRIIQTLCCAHDKAIDALTQALVTSTSLIKKERR